MAFTDAAADEGAQFLLVNDLMLRVHTGPMQGYQGNLFEPDGWYSVHGGFPKCHDDTNNVKVVRIPPPGDAKEFDMEVSGFNIGKNAVPGALKQPSQDFALYIYNAIEQ